MRYVERDRIEPPEILVGADARASRERVYDLFMSSGSVLKQTRADRSRSIVDEAELRMALSELFGHACAFCESPLSEPLVYRFRPAEGAHPVQDRDFAHLYYAWLADAWQNLYPICRECTPQDPFYFPVANNQRSQLPNPGEIKEYIDREDGRWPLFPLDEAPLFLDPCYDRNLWRHLRFLSDGSIEAYRNDRRGRATILHFKLDRPGLTQQRGAEFGIAFERLLSDFDQDHATRDAALSTPHGLFPGAWRLYLRDLLARALGRGPSGQLRAMANNLLHEDDWRGRLGAAHQDLLAPQVRQPSAAKTAETLGDGREPQAIAIRDFKSLEHVRIDLPSPITSGEPRAGALLILGENAAGKSTILEAIAIALMTEAHRDKLNLKAGRLVLNPYYLGSDASPAKQAMIELSYGTGEIQSLRIVPSGPRSRERYLAQDFVDEGPYNPIPLFAYGAFRQYLHAEKRRTAHKHIRNLFQTDQLLSNPERWLLRLSQTDFNMAVRALRDVFSIGSEFDVLERRDRAVFVVHPVGDTATALSQRTPLNIVSSGFRAVLAMLCDIMEGLMNKRVNPSFQTLETARAIVLIDEIEAHLHPRWKMAIMTGLRRALPQVTFIATSHDPLCLRGMGQGEVVVLDRIPGSEADSALPVFTQSLADLPDNQHWTVEQLLTADFFQLRTTAHADEERRMKRMEDKLAQGVRPEDDAELQTYLAELSATLPIGDSAVKRVVEGALADFLAAQRQSTQDKLKSLERETREKIAAALRGQS